MEINGQSFTDESAREMLKVLETHLISEFGSKDEEVQHLTFEDAKAMYESNDGYPTMYWKLAEKLRDKHYHTLKNNPREIS